MQRGRRVSVLSSSRHPPSSALALVLASLLLLTACGGSKHPPPTPNATTPPSGNNLDKVDPVFLRLLAVYQAQGVDAARQYARDQQLLTKQDEVRVTLGLDSDDASVVDGTAIAVGRLGGQVTATHGKEIEIVIPVQTLVNYRKQSNRQSFFADLADFQHVRDITRTPVGSNEQRATRNALESHSALVAHPSLLAASARSEGVRVTGADRWQAAGWTGKGVTIGIIDSSFTHYQRFISDANVTARSFRSDRQIEETTDDDETIHGTACAEIVREMAPDAQLLLAAADTPGAFIDALRWLSRTAHADIVSTSLGFYGAYPLDGSSELSQAVDEAKAAGVFVVKSAGNSATTHYRATFTDADHDGFHDFPNAKSKNGLAIKVGSDAVQIYLTWDDWKARKVNYDLVLLDSTGREVGRSDIDQTRTGKRPTEQIVGQVAAGTYRVRVQKVNPTDPDLPFDILVRGATPELAIADGSISVPGDARGAVTVAAVNWRTTQVEDFSSRGPTNDGRAKPDLGAPDRVGSDAYRSVGTSDFAGTSAAAPHTAGAAALYKQAVPDATPDAIRVFFVGHAKGVPGTMRGDNVVGAGELDLGTPPTTMMGSKQTAVASATANTPSRTLARPGDRFADDFTMPTTGLAAPGYQNGAYRLTADASAVVVQAYGTDVSAPNATYAVQARKMGGADDAAMGIVVRRLDKDNYLLFAITNDGAFNVLAKVHGSLHAALGEWKTSGAIARNGANALQVEAAGAKFTFSVNGQVVSVVEIPDIWMNGGFGLAVGGGKAANADIAFTAYRVAVP